MKLDFTEKVVDVQIRNISGNTNISDLETIMIMAAHNVFTAPELFRTYTTANAVNEDGFALDSYVYNSANLAFSQEVRPSMVVVSAGVVDSKYVDMFQDMLNITQGWLWLVSDLRDAAIQEQLAKVVEPTDKYYVAATHDANAIVAGVETDIASVLKPLQYNQTYVWYDDAIETVVPDEDPIISPNYTEIALVARCTSGTIGTVQFLVKKLIGVGVPASIKTETHQNTLTAKGYTFAANASGAVYSYGSGKVVSGEWIDIRLGITWMKIRIRERIFGTISSRDKLGYEADGAAAIEADVRAVLQEAKNIGIIAQDSQIFVSVPDPTTLSVAQRSSRVLPDVKFTVRMQGAIISTIVRGEVYQ